MKYARIIIAALSLIIISTLDAQLLQRESIESRIATGTRPEWGDFGFFIGPSLVELVDVFDDNVDIRGFPLMGFKYYLDDNIELRLQTSIYSKTSETQGTLVNTIGIEDNVEKESFMRFMPSFQYHFSSTNFLDTYIGVGGIIGSDLDEVLTTEKLSLTGDFNAERLRQRTLVYGYNINFGLQAFVADLPISLGVEASIRSTYQKNLQFEGTSQSSVGGVINEQTFFTEDRDSNLRFEDLTVSESELGADIRFIISYYFRS